MIDGGSGCIGESRAATAKMQLQLTELYRIIESLMDARN